MNIKFVLFSLIFCCFAFSALHAQEPVTLEGYVFEEDNRGYISKVKIVVLDSLTNDPIDSLITGRDGKFSIRLKRGKKYVIQASKREFVAAQDVISTFGLKDAKKIFLKFPMERKPGYIFDVTIAEERNDQDVVNAIDSARIEIYNNTTEEEVLVLENYPNPNFQFTFIPGNHYTIMIRRKNYFNKRIEAYVNVEGCILCFDGLGTVEPGVTDVMQHGNAKGTFLANVELQPLILNKTYQIENIYYDYNKWDIRSDAALELNRLIGVLKDNPAISIELGSHTDSRGKDEYNRQLSEKRATAAVQYLVENGIDSDKLQARGYGEVQLVNECRNGVKCSDEKHQENRRTELKITGIEEEDPLDNKTLKEIIVEEKLLDEVMNQEIIKYEGPATNEEENEDGENEGGQ